MASSKRQKRATIAGAVAGGAAATRTPGYKRAAISTLKKYEEARQRNGQMTFWDVKPEAKAMYGRLGIGVAAGAAIGYGGYKAYKHYKTNQPNSPANARNQISQTRTNGRVGKKPNQPFYYRTVKGKKQRVKKGKR